MPCSCLSKTTRAFCLYALAQLIYSSGLTGHMVWDDAYNSVAAKTIRIYINPVSLGTPSNGVVSELMAAFDFKSL